MHELARRAGVYFGFGEPAPQERLPEPPVTVGRRVVALVVVLAVAACLALLLGQGAEGAVGFAGFAVFVLVGTAVARRGVD